MNWSELTDDELTELFHGRFGDAKEMYRKRTGKADAYEACRFAQYVARIIAAASEPLLGVKP